MESAYKILFAAAGCAIAVCAMVCLYRSLKGPHTADRIIFINMISTITILLISVVAVLLREDFLIDIALIYALLGFISSVLLSRIFISIRGRKDRDDDA